MLFFFLCRCGPTRAMASSFLRSLDHTQRRTTVGRTSVGEWWARRRDLYLTTHNTRHRQTSMTPPPGGIRTHNPSMRAAADLRLRPRGYWDRFLLGSLDCKNYFSATNVKHCGSYSYVYLNKMSVLFFRPHIYSTASFRNQVPLIQNDTSVKAQFLYAFEFQKASGDE